MRNLIFSLLGILCLSQIANCQTGINFKSSDPVIKSNTPKDSINKNGNSQVVFKTPEIIKFNYNQTLIDKLENEIETSLSDLYDDSLDDTPQYSSDQVNSKLRQIEEKRKELGKLRKAQDSLYLIYAKDELQYDTFSFFSFGPRKSKALFDYLYGNENKKFKLLNHSGFMFGDNTGSIYSELISGDLGFLRVSFGSMVSSSSSTNNEKEKQEEAYQRLATYGGNTVLTFEYPLLYTHDRENQFNLLGRWVTKLSADLPEFGTQTDKFAGSFSTGIDFYGDASLSNNSLRFFTNFHLNGIYGSNTFQENLNIDNDWFSFGQWTVGIVIANSVKLSYIVSTFSSQDNLNNRNGILGGQLIQ